MPFDLDLAPGPAVFEADFGLDEGCFSVVAAGGGVTSPAGGGVPPAGGSPALDPVLDFVRSFEASDAGTAFISDAGPGVVVVSPAGFDVGSDDIFYTITFINLQLKLLN